MLIRFVLNEMFPVAIKTRQVQHDQKSKKLILVIATANENP